MTASASYDEYARRMHRVQAYIDRNLERSLDLAELADVAHFSPFHFHRLFSAWMGETLGDYLRRRRLEIAAMRLAAQPRVPVLNVALSVGFGSAEAFARAFKQRFGCTATQWRRNLARQREQERRAGTAPTDDRNLDQAHSKRNQVGSNASQDGHRARDDHGSRVIHETEAAMKVKMIDRAPAHVAYLRYTGPYGPSIGAFWMNVVAPWLESNDLLGNPRYGISHDDPDITAAERCRYDAAVEVPSGFVPTGNALTTTIPGGRYAAMHFQGTSAEIVGAWRALLRDWLPRSGMQLDSRHCFEYYSREARYDPATGVFECGLVIPITPL